MPDENPNLDIRATLDASSVLSSAPRAADALKQVASETATMSEAAETASAQTGKLTEHLEDAQKVMMRNAFYVHRLAEGFKDISLGGRAASQGLMDVSESLQYMLGPEVAIYAAMAQVVIMLGMMAEGHKRGHGEAKEHADAEKEAAEATDKMTEALIAAGKAVSDVHLSVMNEAMKEYVSEQRTMIDQQKEWDDATSVRLKNTEAEVEAQQKLTLAQVERQKQTELNAATTTEEKDAINAEYAARELSVKGGSAAQKYGAEKNILSVEAKNAQSEIDTQHAANADVIAKRDALEKRAQETSDKAKAAGFVTDEAGSFADAVKGAEDLVKAYRAQEERVNEVTPEETTAIRRVSMGSDTSSDRSTIAARNAERKLAQYDTIKASTSLADVRDAQQAHEALGTEGKELTDEIKKNSDAIDKLGHTLENLTSKGKILDTDYATTQTQLDTEGLKDQGKAKDEAARASAQQASKMASADSAVARAEQGDRMAGDSTAISAQRELIASLSKQASDALKHHQDTTALMVQIAQAHAKLNEEMNQKIADEAAQRKAQIQALLNKQASAHNNSLS